MDHEADFVYHYCGAAALLSVATTRVIWATDLEYLNDRFEGQVLPDRLRFATEHPEHAFRGRESFAPRYLETLLRSLNVSKRLSVSCFSTHRASLPMFRMYGPSNGGYVIGFRKQYLQRVGTLYECEYGTEPAHEWSKQYIRDFCEAAARVDEPSLSPDELFNKLVRTTDLYRRRVDATVRYKSADFSNEAEFRLVPSKGERRFRASADGSSVIPYVPIELPNDPVEVRLLCGPHKEPALASATTNAVCEAAQSSGVAWNFAAGSAQLHAFRV